MIERRLQKLIFVRFYQKADGTEPVRGWLKELDRTDRRKIGTMLQKLEFGWPVGLPHCRSLGSGLWEARRALDGNRAARVLFCVKGGDMVLLHAFIKKSQQTPKSDLDVGIKRMRSLFR
ncbi:MAG: type II toxin-antitoxin system RelE/ParE family toxin [Rhodospirillaceae bacterium]|nr:type II toxin-antitoxin system RelE/ParE family toxin [Rhodospirillaceae bacterium]